MKISFDREFLARRWINEKDEFDEWKKMNLTTRKFLCGLRRFTFAHIKLEEESVL